MHLRDLTQFLAELSDNNNRAWFVMNKPRYDILRAEFLELVTGLIAAMTRFDPLVADCNPKKALFRINRDMRFSHVKIPYKTTFSAAIIPNGMKKPSQGGGPSYYFQIDAAGNLLVAGGEYMPPADRLRMIRQHVIADPGGLAKVLKSKNFDRRYGGLQQEGKLTRPPKGFDAGEPQIETIKLKNFIAWSATGLTGSSPATLESDLTSAFKDVQPLIQWLREA